MTFHGNKKNIFRKNEKGVTLLLSVLLLSAITAVAFSVSTLTLIETRTSNDVARTDISYYHDQGLAEDAIFVFKRQISSSKTNYGTLVSGQSCSNYSTTVQGPSYPSVTNKTRRCLFNTEHIIKESLPTSASSYADAKKFFLYDPSQLTPGSQNSGFAEVRIDNLGAASITVYLCRLDTICDETLGGFSAGTPTTIGGGSARVLTLITAEPNRDSYELAIKNNSLAQAGEVQLTTYGPDSTTPKGLPYLNKEGLEIEATRGSLTRRVQVLVPTQ